MTGIGFLDFVNTSVTGRFTFALYLVSSGIHNLLFFMKNTSEKYQQPAQCRFRQARRMQFASGCS